MNLEDLPRIQAPKRTKLVLQSSRADHGRDLSITKLRSVAGKKNTGQPSHVPSVSPTRRCGSSASAQPCQAWKLEPNINFVSEKSKVGKRSAFLASHGGSQIGDTETMLHLPFSPVSVAFPSLVFPLLVPLRVVRLGLSYGPSNFGHIRP